MITINDFKDISFLNDNNLKESKKILKKVFLIDFDSNEWFDEFFLLNVADSEDQYDSTYFKSSLNDWLKRIDKKARIKFDIENGEEIEVEYQMNYCLDRLHKATMSILKNYTFELEEYFPNIYDNSRWCYQDIGKYLLDNMKLDLCVIKELNLANKKYISLDDAFKDYIKFNKHFKNIEMRDYILNEINMDYSTFNERVAKYRANFKRFKGKSSISNIDTKFFYKEDVNNEKINEISKHVLLYMLDKWNKFAVNDEEFISINYSDIKDFFSNFLDCDVTTTDIFLFEKIYEIYYKMGIFLIGFNKFNDYLNLSIEHIQKLVEYLINIIQLPNLIASFDLVNIIMEESIINFESNPYDECTNVIRIYKHIDYYLIPLYNMVFANILNLYCNTNDMVIEEFLKIRFRDEDILKEYRNKCKFLSNEIRKIDITKLKKQEKNRKQNKNEFELIKLIPTINRNVEEIKKYKNKIKDVLWDIERYDIKLLDIVQDKENYQKSLKQLILNGIISH